MCQKGKIFILQLLLLSLFTISSTFAQHLASNRTTNLTLSQNETKQDSNITWIKISPITSNTTIVEESSQNCGINCTTTENIFGEYQNVDIASNLRRKRRKRRRNKNKAWNQRRPEHSYKKHSTKVEINKPAQFLIPPDHQENLITKETTYYKSRNDVAEKFLGRTEKKIPPPARHLLPPLVDLRFVNSVTPSPVQREAKKSKQIEWSPNSTNRGLTKFKHTIYYSDSGNEIISNYEITSTTSVPRVEFTISGDSRTVRPTLGPTEIPRNRNKLEYRPIVVQPTPIQYHTTPAPILNNTAYPSRETRINSLLSFEVANAGMRVINMTAHQPIKSPPFQNQFIPNKNYRQSEQASMLTSPNSQQVPTQQLPSQPINHQQYQSRQETAHPVNNQHLQSQGRVSQLIDHQQPQSQQLSNYQQSQAQQPSNYQQYHPPDDIPPQINYQQPPFSNQISHQVNYQQLSSQRQQTQLSQSGINYSQSQLQRQPPIQPNNQQYQQTQSPPTNTASNSQNFQQIEHLQQYQTHNTQSLQNYQPQTTYGRETEQHATTPTSNLVTNQTTTSQADKTENFKGLDLAESKYFSDIPSEQEFNAVHNDGQVIPGVAGKDYPVFDQFLLQKRRFHCRGLEGYFADVSSRCQVFYICNGDGAGEPMLCPNGTLFSQELLVCDWWYNVDC